MHRPFLLRLAAAAAAGVTLLPALPAAAGGPPSAPGARGLGLACPADRVSGGGFADTAGSVHASAVDCLAFYGVTKGGADGTFGAGKAVTRAQLATFLARVLGESGVELPAAPADAFTDDEGSAHEDSLNALAELDVVNGAGDGTVSPEQPVRRDQMASFLVRLLELVTDEDLAATIEDYFDDTDGSVHRGPINALAGLGIAAGRAKGIFDPSSEVKREQMATFLMRLIDRLVEKGEVKVPVSLKLSAKKASPGDVVTATVVGEGLTAASIVGCGFDGVTATGGPVDEAEPATDPATDPEVTPAVATPTASTVTFTFALTVPDAWPAEGLEPADESMTVAGRPDGAGRPQGGGRPKGRGGDDEDECAFTVLVTLADGEVEELEGELELREKKDDEGKDVESDESDDDKDPDDDDEAGDDESGDDDASDADADADDEPVSTDPTV